MRLFFAGFALVLLLLLAVVPVMAQDGTFVAPTDVPEPGEWYVVAWIIAGVAVFLIFPALGYVIGRVSGGEKNSSLDAVMAMGLLNLQQDRPRMAELERRYADDPKIQRLTDLTMNLITVMQPLLPFFQQLRVDDGALAFLQDMSQPGPPNEATLKKLAAKLQVDVQSLRAIAGGRETVAG